MLVYVPLVGWVDAAVIISLFALVISILAFGVAYCKYKSDTKRASEDDRIDLINELILAQSLVSSTIVKLDLMDDKSDPAIHGKITKIKTGFVELLEGALKTLNEELLQSGKKLQADRVEYADRIRKALTAAQEMHDQVEALYNTKK